MAIPSPARPAEGTLCCRLGEVAIKTFYIALACAMFALGSGAQAAMPQPPCAGGVTPAYPAPEAAPAIAVWHASDLEQGKWRPPGCTGWPSLSRSNLVIALTGSLRFDGDISGLLARIGMISALPKVQYWSTTDKMWRPLAYDASALTGPDAKNRRSDFSPSELTKDADLYYWENDSRSGEATYRLRVYCQREYHAHSQIFPHFVPARGTSIRDVHSACVTRHFRRLHPQPDL